MTEMTAILNNVDAPIGLTRKTGVRLQLEALYTWDLSRVRRFMVEREGWSQEWATRVELEYRRFVELSYLYHGIAMVPSCHAVDEFWHTHVLFTRDYAAFCEAVGKRFMHHDPTLGNEAEALQQPYAVTTLPAYIKHFGTSPPDDIWLAGDAICGSGPGPSCNPGD